MSLPNTNGDGTVDPRMLSAADAIARGEPYGPPPAVAGLNQTQALTDEEANMFLFPPGSGGSPNNILPRQLPHGVAAEVHPLANEATRPTGNGGYLFGEYGRLTPGRFDLDALANGLQDRYRTFVQPAGDDVEDIMAAIEEWAKYVHHAIGCEPANPSVDESTMRGNFVRAVQRIEHRDVVVTQVAAEIVRAVVRLHEPSEAEEGTVQGMRVDETGNMVVEKVDVEDGTVVIGDHLRLDQVEDLAPLPKEFIMKASERVRKVSEVLAQNKDVALSVLNGRDAIAKLVAAPCKAQRG